MSTSEKPVPGAGGTEGRAQEPELPGRLKSQLVLLGRVWSLEEDEATAATQFKARRKDKEYPDSFPPVVFHRLQMPADMEACRGSVS